MAPGVVVMAPGVVVKAFTFFGSWKVYITIALVF